MSMSIVISILVTFLVIVLIVYLVDLMPIGDARIKNIIRIVVIIIGILVMLKYLAVF